jgi:hypothetical protein
MMIAASITPKPIKPSQFVSNSAAFKVSRPYYNDAHLCKDTDSNKEAIFEKLKEGRKKGRKEGRRFRQIDLGKGPSVVRALSEFCGWKMLSFGGQF